MKAEYKKELGKSYLIIKPEAAEDSFSVQMLLENQIRGLLCYERRVFNGEPEYYYDITGKHSLESRTRRELFGEKNVRALLQSLYCTVGELHSYFLEPGGILTDPEYIYMDEDRFYFGYFPSVEKENADDKLAEFSEWLQEQIDYEEEGAMHLTYRFYQMIKESEKGILRILEDVLTEKFGQEEELSEVSEAEALSLWQESEEPSEEGSIFLKRDRPDMCSIVFFLLSFLVSLCYLGTTSFPEMWVRPTGVIACVFVLVSILGIAAGFVDIDIEWKK